MSKIKSIQISDFRIYNGDQEFTFDNAGLLSNLMVIYAPNGFGKTSFFDAIEWCYASKIRRFETDVLGEEIDRRDYSSGDKILLTNRKSFKNGKSGAVTICTSDNKVVKRTASERKANNLDFKYDYRTISTLTSDYNQVALERLVKTNILTQDQIDEFLRHTKADERFFQLQNFWPEGESAVSILEKLDSYLQMLSLEKQTIESEIGRAEQQIKEYLNADEQISPLNALIDELSRKSVTGFNIERLTANVNAQTYKTILSTVQTFIERSKLFIANIEAEILKLNNLEQRLPIYSKALLAKPTIEEEISKLTSLGKLYTDLRSYSNMHSTLETSIGVISNAHQKLKRLLELLDSVAELYSNISTQRAIAKECRDSINYYLKNIDGYRVSSEKLISTLNDWKKQEEILSQRVATWDTELADYNFWIAEREKLSPKLEASKRLLEEKELAIKNLISRRHSLEIILENHNYQNLLESDVQGLTELLSAQNDKIALINEINDVIKELHGEIENAESLEETFDKVIAWGEQYVINADAAHCPLCATEFSDVTTLLNTIQQQKSGNSKTGILKERLDQAKIREQTLSKELAVINQSIDSVILNLLNVSIQDQSNLQMERDQLRSDISSFEKSIENATFSAGKSLSNLQFEIATINSESKEDFHNFKMDLEARHKEVRLKTGRLASIVIAKNELISNAENTVSILRNRLSASNNNVEILRADPRLLEAEQIMKELDLRENALSRQLLENRLAEVASQRNDLEEQLRALEKEIENRQQQIKTFSVQVSESELAGIRFSKQEELTDYDNVIKNYITLFKAFSTTDEPRSELLAEFLNSRRENLKSATAELRELEELIIKLQVIEKNVTKNALEQQLKELSRQVGPIEKSLEKVKAARQTAEKYINGEINKYFNQDVINQIYSRIEPHPDLNEIRINPKVSEKGPILDIKAISSQEELDPSLYLSAGQLNVLSLSIFLAKAFETRSEEIDTIFMDDPIQNLSDINILSFIDLIRTIITKYDRQIVISSHDENFYKLIRNKMPSEAFNARYYEIESFGKAKHVQ